MSCCTIMDLRKKIGFIPDIPCIYLKQYTGTCANSLWKGDNYCDDENNNCGCEWDGGDCCGKDVNTTYCKECECLDPSEATGH